MFKWLGVLAFAVAAFGVTGAVGQEFPSRTITIVVPLSPGAGTDAMARYLAQKLGPALGRSVVIENKPGAGTVLGSNYAARAEPDGYTLLVASNGTIATAPLLNSNVAYHPINDFAPVALLVSNGFFLVNNPKSKIRSLKELIAAAKANPGSLSYGSSGVGTSNHIFMEMLMKQAGIKLVHVPYTSSAQVMNDIVAGHIDVAFTDPESSVEIGKAGQARLLAVSTLKRHPLLPDVPTVAEAGLPGYEALSWLALVAPKKTPAPIVDRLHEETLAILNSQEFRSFIERVGPVDLGPKSPSQVRDFFVAEIAKWSVVLKDAGLTK